MRFSFVHHVSVWWRFNRKHFGRNWMQQGSSVDGCYSILTAYSNFFPFPILFFFFLPLLLSSFTRWQKQPKHNAYVHSENRGGEELIKRLNTLMCSRQTSLNICVLLWGNADRGYGQRFHSKKVLDLLRLVSGFAKEKKNLWVLFFFF